MFTREDGSRIRDVRKAWTQVTNRAVMPNLLVHDLRRSAIRRMTAKLLKRENRNPDQNLQGDRLTIELGWPEGPVIANMGRPVKSHVPGFRGC